MQGRHISSEEINLDIPARIFRVQLVIHVAWIVNTTNSRLHIPADLDLARSYHWRLIWIARVGCLQSQFPTLFNTTRGL